MIEAPGCSGTSTCLKGRSKPALAASRGAGRVRDRASLHSFAMHTIPHLQRSIKMEVLVAKMIALLLLWQEAYLKMPQFLPLEHSSQPYSFIT